MSNDIVTVDLDDPVGKVKELFEETRFHHLLVVTNDKLFGVISDRDLYKSINPKVDTAAATRKDLACLRRKVHQIMTRRPFHLHEDDTVTDAINMFNEHSISCIPVVDENSKPVGILSWRDIMRELGKNAEMHP